MPSYSFSTVTVNALTEAIYTDTTTQTGALDALQVIKFGAGGASSAGIVSMDAAGIITALKSGPVLAKTRIRAGRVGAPGVSQIVFLAEASTDGGTTWAVLGNVANVNLENSAETDIFFDFSPVNLVTGLKIRQRFARSSTGSDFGDLTPFTPSAALQAAGVPIAPSAQLSVYRYEGYPYV